MAYFGKTFPCTSRSFGAFLRQQGMASAMLIAALFCLLTLGGCSQQLLTATSSAPQVAAKAALAEGATIVRTPIAFPSGFMTSVTSYGAVGDGVHDDTAAIQAALADGRSPSIQDYNGRPKALYFPQGIYLVRDTLQWIGCCVLIQGDGVDRTIIRLAPKSSGFADTANPKPLILTPNPSGNESFRQNIWDLTVAIGPGNPGATAINYVSNNTGSLHDVEITSEDGTGHAGIDLTRTYAGPLLIRNALINGFDVGIDLQNAEYGTTIERLTVQDQNVVGVRNVNQPLNIRNMSSQNYGPALTNHGGKVILLDANLQGGNTQIAALQTDNSMYLRNIASTYYKATVSSTMPMSAQTVTGPISELVIGTPSTLTGDATAGSLKLPVQETPSFVSTNLSDWAAFLPGGYGDNSTLQGVMNSGKPTIYFPFQTYFAYNEADVTVPDSVDRIVGFTSVVNSSPAGVNGGGIRLIVTSNSTVPLIVEEFGYGLKVDHRGSRPVVIKDGNYMYTSSPGAGDLYLEDVEIDGFAVQQGQHVWARQLDTEPIGAGTKIENLGGGSSLWILGIKSEQPGTVIDTASGGETELLGGLVYPAVSVPSNNVAFASTDAQVSYIYAESTYCTGCGYTSQVGETRSGRYTQITSSPNNSYSMPLFVGYR